MKLQKKGNRDRYFTFSLQALFSLGYLGLFVRSLYRPLTPDEYEGVHTGWKILQGKMIYVDFFQHHHPLTFYVWAGLIKIWGETFLVMRAARALQFLFFSFTLLYSHKLVTLLFNRDSAWVGLVLLLAFTIFTPCAIDIRPDILSLTFLTISLFYLFAALKEKDIVGFSISGVALALAFLCIQKIVIFVPLIFLILMYDCYYYSKDFKPLLVYALSAGTPVLSYVIYLLFTGAFYDYFICNIIFNTVLLSGKWPIRIFIDSLQENAIVWTFFLVGASFCETKLQKYFFAITGTAILLMFLMKSVCFHYYMPSLLFVALIAGYGFIKVFENQKNIAAFILFGFTIGQLIRPYSCWYKRPSIKDDKVRIEYAHNLTPKDGCMYNRRPYLNLYRDDLDYLWFVPLYADKFFKAYNHDYSLIKLIKEKKPKFLYEPYENLLRDEYVQQWYSQDKFYKNLFIRK